MVRLIKDEELQEYKVSFIDETQSDAIMFFVSSLRYSVRIGLHPRKTISFEELFEVAKNHCINRYKYCDLETYDKD